MLSYEVDYIRNFHKLISSPVWCVMASASCRAIFRRWQIATRVIQQYRPEPLVFRPAAQAPPFLLVVTVQLRKCWLQQLASGLHLDQNEPLNQGVSLP